MAQPKEDNKKDNKGWDEPSRKAYEMGAKVVNPVINWIWANSFPTVQIGADFVSWLTKNKYEHRGVYSNGDGTSSVRYR